MDSLTSGCPWKITHRSVTCLHFFSHFGRCSWLPVFLLWRHVLARLHVLLLQQPVRVELSILINELWVTGETCWISVLLCFGLVAVVCVFFFPFYYLWGFSVVFTFCDLLFVFIFYCTLWFIVVFLLVPFFDLLLCFGKMTMLCFWFSCCTSVSFTVMFLSLCFLIRYVFDVVFSDLSLCS